MPRISEFFGINIYMYFKNHNPPHFHAIHSQYEVEISINDLRTINGDMPKKMGKLVRMWAEKHQKELATNWQLIDKWLSLKKIAPLK